MGIREKETTSHGTEREPALVETPLRLVELARPREREAKPSGDGLIRLDEVRKKLAGRRDFWRSFDQVLETEAYKKRLDDEFPERDSLLKLDRRDFMKFLGASAVMAGLAGCRNLPTEKIVPYVRPPEEFVPGKPIEYATTFVHDGFGIGVLAESHMGRPTKIEGNPDHPASLGSTDAFTQASVYGLYDPDRAQEVSKGKDLWTWEAFYEELYKALEANPGGLRILAEATTSPSLLAMLRQVESKHAGSKVYHAPPAVGTNALEGAVLAFGRRLQPVYDLSKADVIVTLDSDFLATDPGRVRYARDFSSRRQADPPEGMCRVYTVESYPTLIGTMADHRATLKPSQVEKFASWLGGQAGLGTGETGQFGGVEWCFTCAQDLQASRGRSVVIAGEHQPAEVHALAYAMNHALGNVGQTVRFVEPMLPPSEGLRALVDELNAGKVSALLILGGNPVYEAPADLDFASALSKVALTAHWSLHEDETAAACVWHLPANHYLECWGDARAYDGTVSLLQPLISPLYAGRSAHEVVEGVLGGARRARDIVRDYWAGQVGSPESWESWLEKGFIPNSAAPAAEVEGIRPPAPSSVAQPSGLETLFLPDPTIWDGRYANYPWLQELPKPFSSMTWDNTVQLSPRTASAQGLENHDVVEIELNGRKVRGPVWVVPGMADDTAVIHLGYGRTRGGMIAEGPGFNANLIRSSLFTSYVEGVRLSLQDKHFPLGVTHGHHQTEGRDIVRLGSIEDWKRNPSLAPPHAFDPKLDEERNLYNPEEFAYDGHKWAMAIDLNLCIGCNACVTACQAENNIPSVGKEQVIRHREMHWIRIDRYYLGGLDHPEEIVHQPMTCMHCEQAPCEPVCPVAATTHSVEGLNQMVYNRCIGTRYCSNNCPYKVRRFNFINYGDRHDYPSTQDKKKPAPSLAALQNPDVTVRGRGVMEKCTYCVQRINQARIEAKKEGRPIRDGEVVPACAQACPTKTIVFGDMGDPNSAVSKKRAEQRNYQLLEELNTKPRTTYLGKLKNPGSGA
jgi:MoCo/4Fe-4S cofactor protein with predicted Tat translocation signal